MTAETISDEQTLHCPPYWHDSLTVCWNVNQEVGVQMHTGMERRCRISVPQAGCFAAHAEHWWWWGGQW